MDFFDIRTLNNNYAPGIATYGIDGNIGDRGVSGTSVYFTSYNLEYGSSTENEQNQILVKLNQNKVLSSYVDRENERPYIIGDIIIDSMGYVYSIYEKNGSFALQYVSRLKNEDSSTCFSKVNNRVMLNYNGFDIFNVDSSVDKTKIEKTVYPLRIVSEKKDSASGDYKFLSLVAQSYLSDNSKYLNIYYNSADDSFHFDSASNIVFDTSSLMVKGTDSKVSFDEYYKIEPYKDPVGLMHRIYSKVNYSYNTENGVLTIDGIENSIPTMEIVPDYVKVRVLDKNFDVEKERLFFVGTGVKSTDTSFSVDTSTFLKDIDAEHYCVSIIKGTEIYLKK